MFGRRARTPAPRSDGPRDPSLPMLSVEQARALAVLASRSWAEHGVEVVSDGHGVLVATDGQHFGLHNLATVVAGLRWQDWAAAVERHCETMITANTETADPSSVSPEQILLKLRPRADLPMQPDFDASTRFASLVALPAIDAPTAVHELFGSDKLHDLAGLNGWDEVRDRGLANLRALPAPQYLGLNADDDRSDATVHVFTSEDFFGASRVLVLEDMLRTNLSVERPEHGCLVVVPNRHLLAVHLLEGPGVIAAVNLMAALAGGECESNPGPLVDEVFYLPPEGLAQSIVTRHATQMNVDAAAGPFADALTRLGMLG